MKVSIPVFLSILLATQSLAVVQASAQKSPHNALAIIASRKPAQQPTDLDQGLEDCCLLACYCPCAIALIFCNKCCPKAKNNSLHEILSKKTKPAPAQETMQTRDNQ